MAELTLSQLRNSIDASAWGANDTNTVKNQLINKVREAFYMTPEIVGGSNALWKGIITTAELAVVTQFVDENGNVFQTVTLPRYLATIIKAWDKDGPIERRNEWDAVSDAGTWSFRGLSDLSDGWPGISDLPTTGAQMKITTTGTEAGGLTVIFTGTDANGNPLTETVSIPTAVGSATTVNTFYSIITVVKSITANALYCYQRANSTDTLFARYEASEIFPSYRRYQFAFKTNNATVNVKAKRNYYTLSSDNDPVEFGSILAFETGLRAYQAILNQDLENYRNMMVDAISFLNGEQNLYQSDSENRSVQMDYSTSGGSIDNIP